MRLYKKYPNRRLYDTENSCYVTIDNIRESILKGESISVTENSTGNDVTRSVLLQILTEQEEAGHEPVLTNRAIEQIIRFYGDRFGHYVSSYIEHSMLMFLKHQDQYREQMKQMATFNQVNAMKQMMDLWNPAASDKNHTNGRDNDG